MSLVRAREGGRKRRERERNTHRNQILREIVLFVRRDSRFFCSSKLPSSQEFVGSRTCSQNEREQSSMARNAIEIATSIALLSLSCASAGVSSAYQYYTGGSMIVKINSRLTLSVSLPACVRRAKWY